MRHIRPRFKLWPNDGRSVSEVPWPKGVQTPSYGGIQWLVTAPVLPAFPDGAGVCVNGTLPKLGAIVPGAFAPLSAIFEATHSSATSQCLRVAVGQAQDSWQGYAYKMDSRQGYALTVSIPRNLRRVETEDFRPPARQGYGLFRQSYPQSDMILCRRTRNSDPARSCPCVHN